MRKPVILAVVAVVVAACGDDDDAASPSDVQPCTETFADGVVFDAVDEVSAVLCDPGDGTIQAYGVASNICADGRTLYWNDEGWGYVGEPFHRHAAGAEKTAPQAEQTACTG
jgi:hypothetical protein